jgi:hypothetical protein
VLTVASDRGGSNAVGRTDLQAQAAADADGGIDLDAVPSFEEAFAPDDGGTAEVHAGLAGRAPLGDDLEGGTLELDRIEGTGPVRNHHRHAPVAGRLADRLVDLRQLIGVDPPQPLYTQRPDQRFEVDVFDGKNLI